MSTRRRFNGDFKAKVALEGLRADKMIERVAVRHGIHPNQGYQLVSFSRSSSASSSYSRKFGELSS